MNMIERTTARPGDLAWPITAARWRWTWWNKPKPAIPARRWAWRKSPPSFGHASALLYALISAGPKRAPACRDARLWSARRGR